MKSANSNPNQPHPWLTLPTRFSGWVLLLTLALVTAATFGGKNLYFRGDYNIFFDGKNQQLLAYEEIQTTFAKSDNIAIIISPQSGNVFEPKL